MSKSISAGPSLSSSFRNEKRSITPGRNSPTPSSRGGLSTGAFSGMNSRATSPGGSILPASASSRITLDDKFEAMMGRKDLNKVIMEDGEVMFREEFCGACGIIHTNPDLLDMYNTCKSCHCTLREPIVLRKRYENIPQEYNLEVLYATYGDAFDPDFAIDVTEKVIKRVKESSCCDRLAFKPNQKLNELLELSEHDLNIINNTLTDTLAYTGDSNVLFTSFSEPNSPHYTEPNTPNNLQNYKFNQKSNISHLNKYIEKQSGKHNDSTFSSKNNSNNNSRGHSRMSYTNHISNTFTNTESFLNITQNRTQNNTPIVPGMNQSTYSAGSSKRHINDSKSTKILTNENKQLRVRYRIGGMHATLVLDFHANHSIPAPFLLILPKQRYLRIFSGTYGYPKGISSTGRMSYDCSEVLQSMIDQNGGSYLSISSFTPLARIFGDPCPGYPKDLRLSFEIVGRTGSVTYSELRGHLRKKLSIQCSPTVAPLIFVTTATYGITPTGRRDRLNYIQTQLRLIESIEHKLSEGIVVQPADLKVLRNKSDLLKQRTIFQNIAVNFIDISVKLQKLADAGGIQLILDKRSFDPNFTFGNPSKGNTKILECCLDCSGHDSERNCESNEMTDTGHNRNFITIKKNRFNILVRDDEETGRGIMSESLEFRTDNASPIIIVTKATYGEKNPDNHRDVSRMIDVTTEIQNQVIGRNLILDTSIDLNKMFYKDPSPGKRKQLRIEYVTRGFTGNLRVREKDDCLVAGIELGYPPVAPPDDDDYVLN